MSYLGPEPVNWALSIALGLVGAFLLWHGLRMKNRSRENGER